MGRMIAVSVICACSTFCVRAEVGAADQQKLPNIIDILADDLGYAELGCYGQKKIKTPNLDRLAAEGIRFTQHYSGSPVCAPSRCCLMTGKQTGHATSATTGRAGLQKR